MIKLNKVLLILRKNIIKNNKIKIVKAQIMKLIKNTKESKMKSVLFNSVNKNSIIQMKIQKNS